MSYIVKKKFNPRGTESLAGTFKQLNEAKQFIQKKLEEDFQFKVNAIYCLYEGMDLIEEFDQSKLVKSDEKAQSGGQQKGSGQSFSPTPFNTAPRPGGMPHSWLKDGDDKKDKDKK